MQLKTEKRQFESGDVHGRMNNKKEVCETIYFQDFSLQSVFLCNSIYNIFNAQNFAGDMVIYIRIVEVDYRN